MGFDHSDDVKTPNMDAFAADSMVFGNAVSTYPLCSPHRAALLTGKHPLSCHMWTNCKIGLKDLLMLHPEETLITDTLHDEGYENAYIGKWHLDASEKNFSATPLSGAVHWDAYTPVGERRHNIDYWYSYGAMDEHLDPHYWHDGNKMIKPKQWSPEHETDVLLDYLEEKRDKEKPFCAIVSWNPPHPPYDKVPGKYLEKWNNKKLVFRENVPQEMKNDPLYIQKFKEYYAAIEGLDENFGRIISYLKKNDLYDNTVIVLSADHGDCMGSHGLYGKNIWYEESIRIPLVIHDRELGKGYNDRIIVSADHMPTLLDLLNVKIPESVQGVSAFSDKKREEAFFCMIPGMPEMVAEYEKRGLDNRCFGWRALYDLKYKYVVDNGTHPDTLPVRMLYDLEADPYEKTFRTLDKDSEEAIEFDKKLSKHFEEQNDRFYLGR